MQLLYFVNTISRYICFAVMLSGIIIAIAVKHGLSLPNPNIVFIRDFINRSSCRYRYNTVWVYQFHTHLNKMHG